MSYKIWKITESTTRILSRKPSGPHLISQRCFKEQGVEDIAALNVHKLENCVISFLTGEQHMNRIAFKTRLVKNLIFNSMKIQINSF